MNIPENNCGLYKGKDCVTGEEEGGREVSRKQRRMKFPSVMMMRLSNKAVKSTTKINCLEQDTDCQTLVWRQDE